MLWKGISVYSLLYKFSDPLNCFVQFIHFVVATSIFNGAEYTIAFPIDGKFKSNAHRDEISELTFGKFSHEANCREGQYLRRG